MIGFLSTGKALVPFVLKFCYDVAFMKWSYSRINSFSFCPKKYQFRYVLEIAVPQKPELAFGVALHAALEKNFLHKIVSREDMPLKEVLQAFYEALEQALVNVSDEALFGPTDPLYLRSMGENFLEQFMTERAPALQPAPRGVETFFNLPLPGSHEMTGKFDLLDTHWVLHDFKTSSKPYHAHKADKTQLVIYAWACERMFGRAPKAICFDVFVKGDGSEGMVALQAPLFFSVPDPSEMARVADNLYKQIEKILEVQSSGVFPRSFMPLRCHWCEFQKMCVSSWEEAGKPPPQRIKMAPIV